jgi:CO/xanthine dehydrogenase Mo-binding subunit
MDELARELGIDPLDLRRRNVVVPGDPLVVTDPDEQDDLRWEGSYGLDQCIDLVEDALRAPVPEVPRMDGPPLDDSGDWAFGTGVALAAIATMPPRGHHAHVSVEATAEGRYRIGVGTAEFGNGTTTVHTQLVATALGTTTDRVDVHQSDTDAARHDTGAFGSAGVVVAGKALYAAAQALREDMTARALGIVAARTPRTASGPLGPAVSIGPDGVRVGEELVGHAELLADGPLVAHGSHDGTPRSLAFTVHGARVAVHRPTGEVRVLHSVQAVDAGTVLNPEQLRGQVEGGAAQAIGSALYEEVVLDETGRVTTDAFRAYRVPKISDVPRTEVRFADTHDPLGPLGAKSMSEAPYNPVAPAVANAVRDAVGVRPHRLPMTRDRVWAMLQDATDAGGA